MKVDGRAISMAVFTLSAFVLASKFLVPTTMQIFPVSSVLAPPIYYF